MTRETKIGLLVGLMFIIVIGVLLSDHLTSATKPEMADTAGAGANAYGALVVPGGGNRHLTQEVTPAPVVPPAPVPAPTDTMRTAPGGTGTATVEIGAGRGPVTPLEVTENAVSGRPNPFVENNTSELVTGNPLRQTPPVAVNAVAPDRVGVAVPPVPPVRPAAREYKAVAGDTLAKIASRVYGKNTKETRDLLINANPSLKAAPDRIVVGRAYVVPAAPEAAPAPAPVATGVSDSTRPVAIEAATSVSSPRIYTVKSTDNLWRIATQQCGSAKAVDAILKLNSDVLKSKTQQLKIGMKLRLPEKSN